MSATTPQGQRYMRLFAYLPLTFQPQAENALLICFGLGATADALVRDGTPAQDRHRGYRAEVFSWRGIESVAIMQIH